MKKFALFIYLSFFTTFLVSAQNINSIREELFYTEFDLSKCLKFHEKLAALNQASPTIAAYEAAAKALIAKHSWNPIIKISSLKQAMQMLEAAVSLDSRNIEIRFLRLYIENSLPTYLGMKDNLEDDKSAIIKNAHLLGQTELNKDIINYILDYMSTSVTCTEDELQLIKQQVQSASD